MKKIYKNAILAIATLSAVSAKAQVATLYAFSQSASSYVAITGGTVFGSTSSDDQTFVDPASPGGSGNTGQGIPIGFSFMFNNNVYDRFGINNNGWIGFGHSSITPNPVDISNTGSNYNGISSASSAPAILQNRVAGFSRDIQAQAGSELRVQTLGAYPTRSLVIQFTNYRKYNNTGDNFNFQIRLYETTNIIEMIYGTYVNNATAGTAEVGLRGNSNADFNNRITNATNTWSNSAAGTTNGAVVNYNNAGLIPASGQSYKWTPPQCSGTLASLTATNNISLVCPGGFSSVSLINSYTVSGITYTWSHSTSSAVGPYTVVANANSAIYTATNITAQVWYQLAATCLNSASTSTSTATDIQVAGTTTNSVPYFEGFEGIAVNNQLPNCSWIASNLPTICQTYTTVNTLNRIPASGAKFASFKAGTAAGGDYFYSNGIQLNANVIYTAGVNYITDGTLGWADFALLVGPSQSTTGLANIASTGAVANVFYSTLSNTFAVTSSGLYYMAIKCVRPASATQYLSFDNLFVNIPCSLNSPVMAINASPSVACSGQPVNITATGADGYSWNTGDLTGGIVVTPNFNSTYEVVGTHLASGCTSSASIMLPVNPSPAVFIVASAPAICAGSSATLTAYGANTYTWNTSTNNNVISVSPGATGSFVVMGSNIYGCVASATQQIVVNPLPVVTATSSLPNEMCVGEVVTLTGSGALNYQWMANNFYMPFMQIQVSPTVSTSYTLTGTDANGCSKSTTFVQNVSLCSGLAENTSVFNGLNVYPNPSNGEFTIAQTDLSVKTIEVSDITGRVILSLTSADAKTGINLKAFSNGIYYVKIISDTESATVKVVKH